MGRYHLQGKTLKHFTNVSTDKIVDVLEYIILQYDDVREIRLVGDGANWIKQIAKNLEQLSISINFTITKLLITY